MATETHAQNGQDSTSESSFEKRAKRVREWLDVSAKLALAGITLWLTIIANTYQQKASVVTMLSQRETAESQLRTSMLEYLIAPFVARGKEAKPPERAAVLLSLLALNFHDHVELKPLLEEVDIQLQNKNNDQADQARKRLRNVAQQVVGRQIAMLTTGAATDKKQENALQKFFPKIFPSEPSKKTGSVYSLYFEEVKAEEKGAKSDVMLLAVEDNKPLSPLQSQLDKKDQTGINGFENPAKFVKSSGAWVCARSPNNKYALRVAVIGRDSAKGTANVATFIAEEDNACNKGIPADQKNDVWRSLGTLILSPYNFPLTDNVSVDSSQRFALTIASPPDENNTSNKSVQLKLIWFPEGYITERERPMNYDQVNRTLGGVS